MIQANILVVTATLGNRKSLKRTVNSVKSIGGERVFHVIVAPKIHCKSLQKEYPNVEVLEEPTDCKGIYPALNYGLKKYAKDFKYLTFINDDDFWLPNYSKLIECLDNNEKIDVAYGKVKYVDETGVFLGEQTSSNRYKSFGALLYKNIVLFTQQSTLMRSELFLKIGGFDVSYKLIADTNFWLESINNKAVFKYVKELCAGYTIQEGQLSSNGVLQAEEHKKLKMKLKFKYQIIPIYEKYLFRILNARIYFKRLLKDKRIIKRKELFHK